MAAVGDAELAKRSKPLRKQLYSEHPDVTATSDAEVAAWQAERQIVVTGSNLKPVFEFTQAGFPAELLHATRDFVQPSPIQSQCWPIVQTGHDLVGIAATGSGKTLAFGLPALRHILAQKEAGVGVGQKGPRVLILSPTRELAQQISAVMEEAGSKCGGRCLCAYGGVPKQPQVKALRAGVEVVVATPGRLEDLCNDGSCRLEGVSYLVLDEADRMLDLGFEPHIRAIAMQTRADRQTLMFSATWPHEIQKLAAEFMLDPVKVTIGSQDLSASHSVTQVVEVIDPQKRDARIIELLQQYHSSRKNRIILFVLYKKEATRVESMLTRKGWKAVAVHGDISQQQRTRAVEQFKAGTVPLLIATDVAARGLDIPDVEAVLNYSFPLTTEDYVHRIGRTGRAGKTGVAHTFFSGQTDKARAGELINVLREAGQAVPEELLKFGTTVKRKESKLYGAFGPSGTVDMTKKAVKITFDDSDAEASSGPPQMAEAWGAQMPAKLTLAEKCQLCFSGLRSKFPAGTLGLVQAWTAKGGKWTGVCKSQSNIEVLQTRSLPYWLEDQALAPFRLQSCQEGITGSALGMMGKVWSTGALQVVQNLAILPSSVHPRNKLQGEAFANIAELIYVPVYALAAPQQGVVAVLEVVVSAKAQEAMVVANVISYLSNLLTDMELSISQPQVDVLQFQQLRCESPTCAAPMPCPFQQVNMPPQTPQQLPAQTSPFSRLSPCVPQNYVDGCSSPQSGSPRSTLSFTRTMSRTTSIRHLPLGNQDTDMMDAAVRQYCR
ncbi:hypothetical protein WJX72_011094 [[Myrmecia] bisecta]|uniref:RNA helicase n=1 Tax=[Myrmecia] bisecta TaxID=41462 RepID=A0AAW1QGH4_9CHLO